MKLIEARIKRAFSMMVCSAVAVSALTVTAPAASAAEVYPTAWEITSEMTIGWNLGNSLDCTYWSDDPTPQQTATAWGNPEPTKALIDKVKDLGFNTVRIPTTWYQHLSYDSATDTYLVDADWMTYVKNTVDFAYDNGMFVILNAHHENWANVDRFTDDTLAAAKKKLGDIWSQVSEAFSSYDYHLVFEGMNEPRQTYDSSVEWGNGDSYSWSYINALNKVFIDTVRASDSDNNKNRLLMIPGYHASDNYNAVNAIEIPENSGNIALSVHAYEPYSFTMDSSESHIYKSYNRYGGYNPSTLEAIMTDLAKIQTDKNVPIIIGEFGASDFNNTDERVEWAKDYISKAKSAGIVCVLWDNNASNTGISESFGFINRSTNELYSNAVSVIDAMMDTINGSGGSDNPDPPTEEEISQWNSKVLFASGAYADGKYDIVISYSGDSAPRLILERASDYSWDAALDADSVADGKAYYKAASITATLEKNGMTQSDVSKICMLATCDMKYLGVTVNEIKTVTRPDDTTGFVMSARTSSSVTFKWDKNETADGYVLEVVDNGTWKVAADKTSNNCVSHKFTGLNAATWYRFRLRAYVINNGEKLYSAGAPVIAEMTAPETITGVSLGARTSSTVTLKWDKNTTSSGCIIERYIDDSWRIIATINSQSSVSYKITGLSSSTEYKFRLRSFRVSGEKRVYGSYSDVITAATAPKDVQNFRMVISAPTAVRLNWNKKTDADGFCIYMYQDGKWVLSAKLSGDSVAYAKTGLASGTGYKFAIRAYKVIGTTTVYSNYAYADAATK